MVLDFDDIYVFANQNYLFKHVDPSKDDHPYAIMVPCDVHHIPEFNTLGVTMTFYADPEIVKCSKDLLFDHQTYTGPFFRFKGCASVFIGEDRIYHHDGSITFQKREETFGFKEDDYLGFIVNNFNDGEIGDFGIINSSRLNKEWRRVTEVEEIQSLFQ